MFVIYFSYTELVFEEEKCPLSEKLNVSEK